MPRRATSANHRIKNASNPPLTRASERTFEAYLPANAKIDSVLAAGPGKISDVIFASPVPGERGHYTVNFPLRPGSNKFAFNYDLPYRGHAVFQTRHPYPLQQFAVMIPRAMKFSSRAPAFEVLATSNTDYQVRAISQLKAGEGPSFEVSGAGALPSMQAPSKAQTRAQFPPTPMTSTPVRAPLPGLYATPIIFSIAGLRRADRRSSWSMRPPNLAHAQGKKNHGRITCKPQRYPNSASNWCYSCKEAITRDSVILQKEKDGGYVVTVPVLPGCFSQGDTRQQALRVGTLSDNSQ